MGHWFEFCFAKTKDIYNEVTHKGVSHLIHRIKVELQLHEKPEETASQLYIYSKFVSSERKQH